MTRYAIRRVALIRSRAVQMNTFYRFVRVARDLECVAIGFCAKSLASLFKHAMKRSSSFDRPRVLCQATTTRR